MVRIVISDEGNEKLFLEDRHQTIVTGRDFLKANYFENEITII